MCVGGVCNAKRDSSWLPGAQQRCASNDGTHSEHTASNVEWRQRSPCAAQTPHNLAVRLASVECGIASAAATSRNRRRCESCLCRSTSVTDVDADHSSLPMAKRNIRCRVIATSTVAKRHLRCRAILCRQPGSNPTQNGSKSQNVSRIFLQQSQTWARTALRAGLMMRWSLSAKLQTKDWS